MEMWTTFGCLYSQAQCALALAENKNDIHDAGQWLIDGKDKILKQKEESPVKSPPSPKATQIPESGPLKKQSKGDKKPIKIVSFDDDYVFCESILKTNWNGKSTSWVPECIKESLLQPNQLLPGLLTIKDKQIQVISDSGEGHASIRVFALQSKQDQKEQTSSIEDLQTYELKPDSVAGKQLETHLQRESTNESSI